jgi:hypothetical protein
MRFRYLSFRVYDYKLYEIMINYVYIYIALSLYIYTYIYIDPLVFRKSAFIEFEHAKVTYIYIYMCIHVNILCPAK